MEIDFFEFISLSNRSKTVDELFLCLDKYTNPLGFDRSLFSLMSDHPSIGKKAGHGVLRSYPEDWMNYYFSQGYEELDPVRKNVTLVNNPFSWYGLADTVGLTAMERKILDEADEAGLKDGIGVPLFGAAGEIAGMGFASSSKGAELHENSLSLIHSMAHQFYIVYKSLVGAQAEKIRGQLTKREKEVLTWVAAGKNNWDIGQILNVSEHCIDYHLRNIYRKFEVKSRVAAVVKGIRLQQIHPL